MRYISRPYLCLFIQFFAISISCCQSHEYSISQICLAEISAKLSPPKVSPGDLFELTIEMRQSDYAEFEITIPPHKRVMPIARKQMPVTLRDGQYVQRDTYVLQAVASGDIHFDELTCLLKDAEGQTQISLPALKLIVTPITETDAAATPQALPGTSPNFKDQSFYVIGTLLALALGLLIHFLRRIRRQSRRRQKFQDSHTDTSLVTLLQSGQLTYRQLPELLLTHNEQITGDLRSELERMIYREQSQSPETRISQKITDKLMKALTLKAGAK